MGNGDVYVQMVFLPLSKLSELLKPLDQIAIFPLIYNSSSIKLTSFLAQNEAVLVVPIKNSYNLKN